MDKQKKVQKKRSDIMSILAEGQEGTVKKIVRLQKKNDITIFLAGGTVGTDKQIVTLLNK